MFAYPSQTLHDPLPDPSLSVSLGTRAICVVSACVVDFWNGFAVPRKSTVTKKYRHRKVPSFKILSRQYFFSDSISQTTVFSRNTVTARKVPSLTCGHRVSHQKRIFRRPIWKIPSPTISLIIVLGPRKNTVTLVKIPSLRQYFISTDTKKCRHELQVENWETTVL